MLNYNSSVDCKKCVSFLKRQQQVELEIVVVDNNSRPADKMEVKQLCQVQGCTFIPVRENRGYNAGNNIGLRYAVNKGYRYALIANPDMEFPQADYIKKLVDVMERNEEIVVCGSNITTPEGIHQNPRYYENRWWKSFNYLLIPFKRKGFSMPLWVDNPIESHYCQGVNGCCLLIRLDFVKKIGFFDETTFLFGEEQILARQVLLAGKKMFYATDIMAIHNHKKSNEGLSSIRLKHWKNSQMHYIRHYSGYPFYGKWFALVAECIRFGILNMLCCIKK